MIDTRTRKALKRIREENSSLLTEAVIQEALEYNSVTSFFHDILHHGCQSGMVSSLIYYVDTHAFFIEHYDEIEELRLEFEENIGEPLHVNGDLMNWFAWFAFEETARKLANELRLDR